MQEVARIILERIYEPIFLDSSHGFRPDRSCHTALQQIQEVWTGVKWFLELDIKDFFNSMDHGILIRKSVDFILNRSFVNCAKQPYDILVPHFSYLDLK